MSTVSTTHSDAGSDRVISVPVRKGISEETSIGLLQNTQQYLKSLLQRQVPDSVLEAAWHEFYRVYSGIIRRYVIAHGVRGGDIEDCVQEV